MGSRRSTRVTQVNPWIPGGEGQLRDLFPLPPWLFLLLRALTASLKHFLITSLLCLSLYVYSIYDWTWYSAFIILPFSLIILRISIITLYLWYKNPTIPLIARRP